MSARVLLVALVVAAGCDASDRPLVVVAVGGSRGGAATVGALPILNGVKANALSWLPPGASELGFEMPVHARGDLQIAVAGFDESNCIVSFAQADVTLSNDGSTHASVTLMPQAPNCN